MIRSSYFLWLTLSLLVLVLLLGVVEAVDEATATTTTTAAADADDNKNNSNEGVKFATDQIEWLRSNGGYYSPNIQIKPIFDSDNADVPLGLYASKGFSKGEKIMVVPRHCLLTSSGDNWGSDQELMCDTARNLVKEYHSDESSKYAPYVSYLFSKDDVPLPSSFSEQAKTLIRNIRGGNLPPADLTDVSYENHCGDSSPIEGELEGLLEFAYRTVVSRAWTEKLVPVLDMINHQSGKYANVDSTPVHGDSDIAVYATRDIAANEQLFLSYMDCIDERGYENDYVLPQMLRDFGFVDVYPQRWTFPTANGPDSNLVFDLDENMEITWRVGGPPNKQQIGFLKKELSRLEGMKSYVNTTLDRLVHDDNERYVAQEYYNSLTLALKHATAAAAAAGDEQEEQGSCDGANPSPTCPSSSNDVEEGYKALTQKQQDDDDDDDDDQLEEQDWMACNDYTKVKHEYEQVYGTKSHYQQIDIWHSGKDKDDDACLYLDNYLHTCASSRPHYHEVFVHYAARFLPAGIKRILYIGGGDSMVLHEVLKYPSLELAVGLELDQEVNRATFMNLGTQPHYDNPKVKWYYGDAAKTMNVLPRDYYGSFDLVIVDILTEVAENLRVNDELNLVEAAMLLMKPGGIIVKNEDEGYVPGSATTDYTKYSVDLVYHDVPLYCLQVFAFGSDTIDFLNAPTKDHGVETLYLKDVDNFQSQFDSWYNYGTEISGSKKSLCEKRENDNGGKATDENDDVSSVSSLGVLMILEAENTAAAPLETAAAAQAAISKALDFAGLHGETDSTLSYPLSENGVEGFTLLMHVGNGYVAARCIPLLQQYCSFDIQLYGAGIEKLDLLKAQLLDAAQSKYSSSYSFVTGEGMVSTDGQKHEDLKTIGPPRVEEMCRHAEVETEDGVEPHTLPSGTKVRKPRTADEFGPPLSSTIHSYSHSLPYKQWQSQKPVGTQAMAQIEAPPSLDIDLIPGLLKETMVNLVVLLSDKQDASSSSAVENWTQLSDDLRGDGLAIVARWLGGNAVATFDGKSRVTLNLFVLSTDADAADVVIDEVLENNLGDWTLAMYDMFPRGTGSVVNFADDIKHIENPIWA